MPKHKSQLRLASIPVGAKYADVSVKTVRRWIAEGRINGYRVGQKLIKVDLNELEASFQIVGGGAA